MIRFAPHFLEDGTRSVGTSVYQRGRKSASTLLPIFYYSISSSPTTTSGRPPAYVLHTLNRYFYLAVESIHRLIRQLTTELSRLLQLFMCVTDPIWLGVLPLGRVHVVEELRVVLVDG